MNERFADRPLATGKYRNLLLAASGLTFLLIVLGGTVCMTDSTLGCPDWPGCFGQIIPPLQVNAIIEYTHRFVAALAGASIIASTFVTLRQRQYRPTDWISRALLITIVFLLAVVVFGAFAVLTGLPRGVAALDVGSALAVLTLVLAVTVAAFAPQRSLTGQGAPGLSFHSPFTRLGLATLAATFFVLVGSVLVAPVGSIVRCLGWPMLGSDPFIPTPIGWATLARAALAWVAGLLALATIVQAWRTQRSRPGIVPAALMMGIFLLIEVVLGWLIAAGGNSYFLLISYVIAAAGEFSALVVMVQLSAVRE